MSHTAFVAIQNKLVKFLKTEGFKKMFYVYTIYKDFIPFFKPNPSVKLEVFCCSLDELLVP